MLPFGRGDPYILFGQVEVVGVGILKARLEPWLPGKPLKEALQIGKGGVGGGLTEFFSLPLTLLFSQVVFKRNRLLIVKRLEFTALGMLFKPRQRLGHRIDSRFALPPGFFKIGEVSALDSFVIGTVRFHGFIFLY